MKLTKARKKHLNRRADGTFGPWRGGKTKAQDPRRVTQHGIAVHIGKEYRRQFGTKAQVGDCVRTKTKSGRYHQQAHWYIKTRFGWRKSPTETRKPSKAEINRVNKNSRRGRK